jgi:deoxyribose-phosphate aldolase
MIEKMDIASYIDHTLLRPEAPLGEYTQLVRDAIRLKFHSVCVSSFHTPLVSNLLHSYIHTDMNTHVAVATTIGFPHGISNIESKVAEMKQAFNDGATEFDFVINLSAVRTSDWKRVKDEFVALRNAIPDHPSFHPILKCILETGLLSDEEIKRACDIIVANKIDFCKTSTGFLAKLEPKQTARYVKLMSDQVKGSTVRVKASGGIKTLSDCLLMIEAGASRIGTSNSVKIMQEIEEK